MKRLMLVLIGCAVVMSVSAGIAEAEGKKSYSPYAGRNFPMNVYWGDTHLHTSYSPDAALAGNTSVGPEEAYRLARGEEIKAHNGMNVKLIRPLDFLVVTDHAEYLGLLPMLRASDPEVLKTETGKRWHEMLNAGKKEAFKAFIEVTDEIGTGKPSLKNDNITRSAWDFITAAADKYNEPGKFTAFIGYEWTSMPGGGNNLHRVVIFKDGAEKANRVLPFSAFDSENPEDLWAYMEAYERETSGNVLSIPHNGNVSNGLMFAVEDFNGKPISREYAEKRIRWEPLYETTQIKGDGETHPFLSPDDEFADYETWDKGNLIATALKEKRMLQYEYTRSALKLGLALEEKTGVNPFKFGLIGSSDAHTGMAAVREDNYWGKLSIYEPSPERWAHKLLEKGKQGKVYTLNASDMGASGYAAVWATENTREAIFDAMRRKEAYATTGSRMTVRFFGGWHFTGVDLASPDWVANGYTRGVPMGGDLPAGPRGRAPRFIVRVLKDPDGANLDRVQVVKG